MVSVAEALKGGKFGLEHERTLRRYWSRPTDILHR
jgi:hypothetical protein